MDSVDIRELQEFLEDEMFSDPRDLEFLKEEGLMNSMKYRRMLVDRFLKGIDPVTGETLASGRSKMQIKAFWYITSICSTVRTGKRIEDTIKLCKDKELKKEMMAIFRELAHNNAAKNMGGRNLRFSGFNVASAFPEMVLFFRCIKFNATETTNYMEESSRQMKTIPKFMAYPSIGQLNLDDGMQALHKNWERHHWLKEVVLAPDHQDFGSGFKEDFYNTKAKDTYPLYNPKNVLLFSPDRLVTKEMLLEYNRHVREIFGMPTA